MIIDITLLVLGFIGLIIANYSDIKTTEVPDWISYSLIISGLSLRILHSLAYNISSYTTIALVNLGIFFIVGNIMYYSRQWGGGDAKLLMGLSVIFATYPQELLKIFTPKLDSFYFPITIFINILLVGIAYSLFFIMYLSIIHRKEFLKEFKLYLQKTKSPRKTILILSILLIVLAIILSDLIIKLTLFSTSILILFLLYLWIYIKAIEKSAMYKKVSPSKLIEGDWLIHNIFHNKKIILKKPIYGITKKQIALLKKYKIKSVEIKQGLVFTPTFLIAVIISLIFGNILNYFF
ncbi:MAG: hypothetical protein CMH62_02290 [Nanoarchaeota archaeon]|nr:hypothetical protein [Nanoarchaeota archaeon]|tara:strand:+ start:1608 stop:2486 length:879 start_codon:yes stop_codon:yes gene_type:complete